MHRAHAVARRLSAVGVRGGRVYWALAEHLAAWPPRESVVMSGRLPIVVTGPDEFVGANVYRGLFERPEVQLFGNLLRPGDLFVDVGANLGYYTAMGSLLVGAHGRVVAIEPSPVCLPRLERLVDIGGLANVRLHRTAVGAAESTALLYDVTRATNSGAATLRSDLARESGAGVEVTVVRLDDIEDLRDAAEIGLLKIDTEGFEADVLAGAPSLFRSKKVRFAMIEVIPEFGLAADIAAFAADHPSYRAFAIAEQGLLRRAKLWPLTPDAVAGTTRQFNMLVARDDAVDDVAAFISKPR
jgi:FkbM family methyltransferase